MDDPFGPIIIVVALTLLAAIVRMAAAAIPYLDEGELRRLAEGESPRARRAVRLIERSEKPSPQFSQFHMAWAALIAGDWTAAYLWLGGKATARLMPTHPAWMAALLLIVFLALALTLAGVVPGHIAAHGRQKLFDKVAPVAEWTLILLSPITLTAAALGRGLLKPFHLTGADSGELVTEEDILQMVDIGEEKGAIESDEKEMIENIFEFNNMDASDCMIHRKDITAIDIESTAEEIMDIIRQSGRSRFPVYEDSLDNVLGILFTRDFLLDYCEGRHTPLRRLIRPAHFVPESVRTDVLFKEMQSRKQHIAIVVDEYGGTSGLITLEDLLEEIVGNIYDEFDPKEDEDIQPLGEGKWRVSGAAELETVAEALNIDLPTDEEFDTLGGLIFSRLTEIPADGQHPVVECFGLRISVEKIADRRVEWAVVEKLDPDVSKDDEKSERT
ncbi:MAG: HlyC/CorC family transporter [Clostridia bacterium]|nr:HlyC/CorC family transporter [Clostridia bacterium]